VEIVSRIPGAAVQPLGIAKQRTVEPDGTRIPKYRLTQDLSFTSNKEGPNRSINSRVDMGAYAEMVYGWCFPRILHFVASMRRYHPSLYILISKYDYCDAYRRIAHSAAAVIQTIAILEDTAYMSLRLTFGSERVGAVQSMGPERDIQSHSSVGPDTQTTGGLGTRHPN
jgi:hypothetical protein